MNLTIDLNADLGEGGMQDEELMALISSANIACGGHAGNQETMRETIEAAQCAGVAIGAHPGYQDPEHFGRRPLSLPVDKVRAQVQGQLEAFLAICPDIHHVKPHGALYHQANQDPELAAMLCKLIQQLAPDALLYAPPFGELTKAASSTGLRLCPEGFIDRRYLTDGSLQPRSEPGAVIHDPDAACDQALQIVCNQQITDINGKRIPLSARTLCIHADSPDAVRMLVQVRQHLEAKDVEVRGQ